MSATRFLESCNALMRGPPREILQSTLELLADPARWTNHARARDAQGRAVTPDHVDAVCWSLEGAVAICCNQFGILPPYFMVLLDAVAGDEPFNFAYGAGNFDETYNHDAVLELLQLAMERVDAAGN